MNTVISNNISAGTKQCCVFVPNGNSSLGLSAPANFNFNLQPYKFTAVPNQMEIGTKEKTEFNRFVAFGKSFASFGITGDGLY